MAYQKYRKFIKKNPGKPGKLKEFCVEVLVDTLSPDLFLRVPHLHWKLINLRTYFLSYLDPG